MVIKHEAKQKNKTFLGNLKKLMESNDLGVELKSNRPGYMVLKEINEP